jgi:hypothetical protein
MLVALGGDPDAPPVAAVNATGAMIYPRAEIERDIPPLIETEAEESEDAA